MRNVVKEYPELSLMRLFLIVVFLTASMAFQVEALGKRYVCVPCGLPCDGKFFDKPGNCPSCGMALVSEDEAKAALEAAGPATKVAILIFDGVEIIDYAGPYEIFGAANFDVYTVARTKNPITTAMGMTVIPKYSFEDVPQPDVLVVPGGGVKATQENAATLAWLKEETAKIKHTMSVCNGSFILASAGLLDGLSATTTNGNIPRLRAQFPRIHVVDDKRFVDNGKIITAAGLSAGIDGALHVVELLMGKGTAQQVALSEEYDWDSSSRFVRASLADRLIPYLNLTPEYGTWALVNTEGGTDRWNLTFRGTSDKTEAELLSHVNQNFENDGKWSKVSDKEDGTTRWSLKTDDGKSWSGTVTVRESSGKDHQFTVSVTVNRAG